MAVVEYGFFFCPLCYFTGFFAFSFMFPLNYRTRNYCNAY